MNKNSDRIYSLLPGIKGLIFNCDGVLFNSGMLLVSYNEFIRSFNIKDINAIKLARRKNLKIGVVGSYFDRQIFNFLRELDISYWDLTLSKKLSGYEKFVVEYGLNSEEIIYTAYDQTDLEVREHAKCFVCPADATPEILNLSDIILRSSGGKGAVNELVMMVMNAQK